MMNFNKIGKWFPKPTFTNHLPRLLSFWTNKTPYEKWLYYYQILKFFGKTCLQLHCVYENRSIGPLGYIPGFFCILNFILLIHTTYFYIGTGDFIKCIPSYCVLGVTVSVSDINFSN